MADPAEIAAEIAARVLERPAGEDRMLVALAGPPASGKSTVSTVLQATLNKRGRSTGLLTMDGFHLDNSLLDARGLRRVKGAPETFDLGGFSTTIERLRRPAEVVVPTFDRSRDISLGASAVITADMSIVVIEGNYLLLDEPGWRDLARHWTFSAYLSCAEATLERRLLSRWEDHGFSAEDARQKALENDLPNARRIDQNRLPADMVLSL